MMPIYDYECSECGLTFEKIHSIAELSGVTNCDCGGIAKQILTASGQYCSNEDAVWIRQVIEVVAKDSAKPHTQEFVRNPTRENYKRWMKKEGLRHLERNEKPTKRDDRAGLVDALCRQYQREARIEI